MEREAYLDWLREYCNNDTLEDEGMIAILITKLMEAKELKGGVSSESLGDYSVSYFQDEDISPSMKRVLSTYRRIKTP